MSLLLFACWIGGSLVQNPLPAERITRWEKEITAIEKRLAAQPPKPGGVFFAGSSSVRLWKLDESFPGQGYVNVGFGGSEVRDSTHFAARILIPHRPRTILLYAGDNDTANQRTPEQVRDDFRQFAKTIHGALPETRILYLAIKPSPQRWKIYDVQTQANRLVQELCASDPRLHFVDVATPLLGPDGKPDPRLFIKDQLHLSPAGYARWVPVVKQALENADRKRK